MTKKKLEKEVVTEEKGKTLINEFHKELIHAGHTRTYMTLSKYYYVKRLKRMNIEEIEKCQDCKCYKTWHGLQPKSEGNLHRPFPFEVLNSDIFGPVVMDKLGKDLRYVVSFTDSCSGYTVIKVIKKIKGENVRNALEEKWIKRYKTPRKFFSDQGRQYLSKDFQNYLKTKKIKQVIGTTYNPQGNGISERLNQQIGLLVKTGEYHTEKEFEDQLEIGFNAGYNRVLKTSPSEIFFGYNVLDPKRRNVKIDLEEISKFTEIDGRKRLGAKKEKKDILRVGMKTYVKTMKQGRTEQKQDGPFIIKQINDIKTAALVDTGKKEVWIGFRRLCRPKEEVSCCNP